MFHSVRRNRRTTSPMASIDTRRVAHGEPPATKNHRTASAPYRSMAMKGSITFPSRFDIFLPSASTISPRQTTFR